jgi:hypothetical protein
MDDAQWVTQPKEFFQHQQEDAQDDEPPRLPDFARAQEGVKAHAQPEGEQSQH